MNVDFTLLDPNFNEKVQSLIINIQILGHKMTPTYGIRSLEEECRLYRRSRTIDQIQAEIDALQAAGAPYTASILDGVGPQPNGPWATNTVIWSQHLIGWAVDFLVDNRVEGSDPVYKVLSEQATLLGLTTGLNFSTPDPGHVQYSAQELNQIMTYPEMDEKLQLLNNK